MLSLGLLVLANPRHRGKDSDRREMGAVSLRTGYYAGFFLASAPNYTFGGAHYGWRAMFLCGLTSVVVAFFIRLRVQEPEYSKPAALSAQRRRPLREIFSAQLDAEHASQDKEE